MDDLNSCVIAVEKHIAETGNFDIGYIIQDYNGTDWINHCSFDTIGLTRNKIYLSFNIEVLILTWKAGYETLPHDHAKNGCWLKVLKGNLSETRYTKDLEERSLKQLSEGEVSFMSNEYGYHSIHNYTDEVVSSIHIYSPPLHKTKYF